jgi:hypothetical protein
MAAAGLTVVCAVPESSLVNLSKKKKKKKKKKHTII